MFEAALVCLALNIYHEARDQPFIGQVAVAQVVMNRVDDPRYPDTVCEVVEQGPTYSWTDDFPVRHRCQFLVLRRQVGQASRRNCVGSVAADRTWRDERQPR